MRNNNLPSSDFQNLLKVFDIKSDVKMADQTTSPACFLRWTVRKVATELYVVAATMDGIDYDFVGNFKSIRDAHSAGRRYTLNLLHNSLSGGRLGANKQPIETKAA